MDEWMDSWCYFYTVEICQIAEIPLLRKDFVEIKWNENHSTLVLILKRYQAKVASFLYPLTLALRVTC